MNLNELPKIKTKTKRRLGQGHGSGRVKTGGRGTKGQKARNSVPIYFEGGALPLIKRLPYLRGKGKNKPFQVLPLIINIRSLNVFKKDSEITIESLVKEKLVRANDAKEFGVKILGDGDINVPLIIKLPISKSAAEKIEKAGGRVEPSSV